MAVTTIPHPHIDRSSVRTLAFAALVALATVATMLGIQAVIDDDTAPAASSIAATTTTAPGARVSVTSADPGVLPNGDPFPLGASSAATILGSAPAMTGVGPGSPAAVATGHADELAAWAAENGVRGLSPASASAAVPEVASVDAAGFVEHQAALPAELEAIRAGGVAAVPEVASVDAAGFVEHQAALPAELEAIRAGGVAAAIPAATVSGPSLADYPFADALSPSDTGGQVGVLPRSAFASDAEWIAANGWD